MVSLGGGVLTPTFLLSQNYIKGREGIFVVNYQYPQSQPTVLLPPTPRPLLFHSFIINPLRTHILRPILLSSNPPLLFSLSHHSVPSVSRYSFRRPHLRLAPAVQPRPPPQTNLPPSLPSLPPPFHRHPCRPSPSLLSPSSPPLFPSSTKVPSVPCPSQTRPPSRPHRVHHPFS
ncbi:hypothetical protein K457DRAFT_526880 [Linnemannia elongata AG-77]|uniref:Uncharacterized protein n=1 Tax=Linnemannia elongata AG-77 TaxID=1314771 RepID=A0A197JV02_9FUNG|nr:hypothetical protein K457DRAFT_526880 [Linnemannia elongata AG-77]